MLCDMQDYTRVSAGLCDMVYNTTLYGIQYYTIWYTILADMLCSTRSSTRSMTQHIEAQLILYVLYINKGNCITPQSISAYASAYLYNCIAVSVRGFNYM